MRGYLNGTEVMNIVSSGLDSPGRWSPEVLEWLVGDWARIDRSGKWKGVVVAFIPLYYRSIETTVSGEQTYLHKFTCVPSRKSCHGSD